MKACFTAVLVCVFASLGTMIFALTDAQFSSAITYTPTTIVQGDTVTFTVNFKIIDEAVTDFNVEGGIDGAVLYTRTFASISAGATRTMSFTWTATAGSHIVFFRLDPGNNATESDEGNNQKELSFDAGGVQHTTDLNFNVGPQITPGDKLYTGTTLNIRAQVYNGNSPVSNVKIKATIDGAQVWQTTRAQMSANEYYWASFDWVATVGSHTLNFIIDPDNMIAEANEGNNEWLYSLTITDPPQPPDPSQLIDLKFNGNPAFNPFNPQEGGTQEVKIRIYLASSLTVSNVKVEGGIDGVKLWEEIFPTMTGYSYKDVKFTWITTPGSHSAYFKIDPDNSIGENNEGNNTINGTTNVSVKPVGPQPGLPCDPKWHAGTGLKGTKTGVMKPLENVKFWGKAVLTGNTAVNLKITAGIDGKTIMEKVFPAFIAEQESDIYLDWKTAGGQHKVWFQIDPESQQNDTDRSNNRIEKDIEVAELELVTSATGIQAKMNPNPCDTSTSPDPDLRLTSFQQISPYNTTKAMFQITVKNESDRCVKGAGFAVYSEGIAIGEPPLKFWVDSEGKISTTPYSLGSPANKWFLKANESKTFQYSILAENVPGKTDCVIAAAGNAPGLCQKLKVKVDFEDTITESNETNNTSPFKVFSWKK